MRRLIVLLASLLMVATGAVLAPEASAATTNCSDRAGLSAGVPTAVPGLGVDPFHPPVEVPPAVADALATAEGPASAVDPSTGPGCNIDTGTGDCNFGFCEVRLSAFGLGLVSTKITAFAVVQNPVTLESEVIRFESVCGPAVNFCEHHMQVFGDVQFVRCQVTGVASVNTGVFCEYESPDF